MMGNNSILLTMLFTITAWFSVSAQDPYLQHGNELAEQRSIDLAKQYQPHIGMNLDQLVLFENKLEEFLIREQNISNAEMTLEDKMFLLRELRYQQHQEMGTILNRRQLRRYMDITQKVQPIKTRTKNEE